MARYHGPVCRLCRRYGEKLFLKGDRCFGPKCAVVRRPNPPGSAVQRRRKVSDRGLQLREKQRARVFYGLLERRLDNVAYRLGFATSRPQARQLVRHGHFIVNGRKVDIPSFSVKVGDVIALRPGSHKNAAVVHALEEVKGRGLPEWMSFDAAAMSAKVSSIPTREQINLPVQEQLIVELYSK